MVCPASPTSHCQGALPPLGENQQKGNVHLGGPNAVCLSIEGHSSNRSLLSTDPVPGSALCAAQRRARQMGLRVETASNQVSKHGRPVPVQRRLTS